MDALAMLQEEHRRVSEAIKVLESLGARHISITSFKKPRGITTEGRARLSEAMKERWRNKKRA